MQFELENRRYFAASVSDRGDDYFSNFEIILAERIEEQKRGECQFYLARNSSGDIVGRVNLRDIGSKPTFGQLVLDIGLEKGSAGKDMPRVQCLWYAKKQSTS